MAILHYSGSLGVFDYDDEMYTLEVIDREDRLVARRDFHGTFVLPHECFSCKGMFKDVTLAAHSLVGFNTYGVTDMSHMFEGCRFPQGFSLGNKFDTQHCVNMSYMFSNCVFGECYINSEDFDSDRQNRRGVIRGHNVHDGGFALGIHFDTSHVVDMTGMFKNTVINSNFSFGKKFDTSRVLTMKEMFSEAVFPDGFTLPKRFDTSSVWSMEGMFYRCRLPKGFSFGNEFNTSKVEDMTAMFSRCIVKPGVTLGYNFDTSSVRYMRDMFREAELPKYFNLGDKFDTTHVHDMSGMFANTKLPAGFYIGMKFNLDNVLTANDMFRGCSLDGRNFDTSKNDWKLILMLLASTERSDMISENQLETAEDVYRAIRKIPITVFGALRSPEELIKYVKADYLSLDIWDCLEQMTIKDIAGLHNQSDLVALCESRLMDVDASAYALFEVIENIPMASILACEDGKELCECVRRFTSKC